VTLSVLETAAVGSLFPLRGASDADSRQYGVREYQLHTDATPPPPFDLKVWHNNQSSVWLRAVGCVSVTFFSWNRIAQCGVVLGYPISLFRSVSEMT